MFAASSDGACALNTAGDACDADGGDCTFQAASTGAACALNGDKTACAVDGGDCVFAGPTGVAACTGSDDGTGTACALSADSSACAVEGGDCSYTHPLGAACALNTAGDACAVDGGDCTFSPAVTACQVLVGKWGVLCQGLAAGTTSPTCNEWGPTAHVSSTVDSTSLNGALLDMETAELGLLQASCAGVAAHVDAACEGHALGHLCSMVPELRTDTCEEIADYQVGLAFCNQQGGPDQSVSALCMSVTSDTAAAMASCLAMGVYETARIECDGFGYDYTTCAYVGSLVSGAYPLLISADMAAAQGLPNTASDETCIDTVTEVTADCGIGYVVGDATTASTTCPTGCTQVDAAAATCSGTATDAAVTCAGLTADAACSAEAGCTLSSATSEMCTDTITEVVMDCATGYVAGDATTPSTTCPIGCTQVDAVADAYIGTPWFTPFPETLVEACTMAPGTTAEETTAATTCTLTAADAAANPAVVGSCAVATGSGTCAYVADGSNGCADFVADGGTTICPMLVNVNSASTGGDRASNCEDWAQTDGHNLGWGQQAVADLAPHLADGVSFQDYCQSPGVAAVQAGAAATNAARNVTWNLPQSATYSIYMSIPDDTRRDSCAALGGPTYAVRVICLDLGFSTDTCAGVQAALPAEVSSCDILVAIWPTLCGGLADGTTSPTCADWGPSQGFIGPTVDDDASAMGFNDALLAMQADELILLQSACAGVATHADAACGGHALGHLCSMVPELRTDTCEEIADYQVGLGYCQREGSPQNAVVGLCNQSTSVAADLEEVCNRLGIRETVFLACDNLGYDYTTCVEVGAAYQDQYDLGSFGHSDCVTFSNTAYLLCPSIAAGESVNILDCEAWAHTDGLNLGWGQSAVADLAPHLTGTQTFEDFCVAAGDPQAATLGICMGIAQTTDVVADCGAFDSPATAVQVTCLNLGFPAETCADVRAGLPPTIMAYPDMCVGTSDGSTVAATCLGADDGTGTACTPNADSSACAVAGGDCVFAASSDGACALNTAGDACNVDGGDCTFSPTACQVLGANWGVLCQGLAAGTTDPTCNEWGPTAHLTGTVDTLKLNTALGDMTNSELALLQTGCAGVAEHVDAACQGHALGHLCSVVTFPDTCGITAGVTDNIPVDQRPPSPCSLGGDPTTACTALADSYTCQCSAGWVTTGSPAGEPTCFQQTVVIQSTVALEGGISQDEFAAGIVAALTPTPAAGDTAPTAPVAEVIVTAYETIVSHLAQLPGTASEYTAGTPKRSALEWGLQRAACGSVTNCVMVVTSLSRRRLQTGAAHISVEFEVTADVDVSDNVDPTLLRTNFVAMVNSPDAPQGLSGMSESDFVIPDPPAISTTVEYTVVLADESSMDAAATALRDPAALTTSLAVSSGRTITATPGALSGSSVPAVPGALSGSSMPAVPAAAPAAVEDAGGGGGGVIVVLGLLLVVGGCAAAVYMFVIKPGQAKAKAVDEDSDKAGFSNPMLDRTEDDV